MFHDFKTIFSKKFNDKVLRRYGVSTQKLTLLFDIKIKGINAIGFDRSRAELVYVSQSCFGTTDEILDFLMLGIEMTGIVREEFKRRI